MGWSHLPNAHISLSLIAHFPGEEERGQRRNLKSAFMGEKQAGEAPGVCSPTSSTLLQIISSMFKGK